MIGSDLSDEPLGSDTVWIIRDNFMAKTFRAHFKKYEPPEPFFIKEEYEFYPYCNSCFACAQENILVRLQNSFANGLNSAKVKAGGLPKYILVVLDEDLVEFMQFQEEGIATLLGTWVEYLANIFEKMLSTRLEQLPIKAKKVTPYWYWVCAPTHTCFSKSKNQLRVKFNLSLESVIRSKDQMRVIRLKEMWNSRDSKLIINNRITEMGLTTYWSAIDASFKYNVMRRESYIAKNFSTKKLEDHDSIPSHELSRYHPSDVQAPKDPMGTFFRRNRLEYHRDTREDFSSCRCDRYGEYLRDIREDGDRCRNFQSSCFDGNRFLLPRLKWH